MVSELSKLQLENNELIGELRVLKEEIETAHEVLTRLGAGKEHWSLAGRIHSLYIIIKGLTPQQAALDPKIMGEL